MLTNTRPKSKIPPKKLKYLLKSKLKNPIEALKPKLKNSINTLKYKKHKLKYPANTLSPRLNPKSKPKNLINTPNTNRDSEDKAGTKSKGEFKLIN